VKAAVLSRLVEKPKAAMVDLIDAKRLFVKQVP
jgi:hypothetical protein